jgi:hypothetical protein
MQIIPKLFHYSYSIPQKKEFQNTSIWNAIIPSAPVAIHKSLTGDKVNYGIAWRAGTATLCRS